MTPEITGGYKNHTSMKCSRVQLLSASRVFVSIHNSVGDGSSSKLRSMIAPTLETPLSLRQWRRQDVMKAEEIRHSLYSREARHKIVGKIQMRIAVIFIEGRNTPVKV